LRSRSSRPGLPNVPLIQDPPTSLEASLPAPPRKPRNVARKRVAKKLKVTETTSQEVSSLSSVVKYLILDVVYANDEIPLLVGDSAFRSYRPRGRKQLGHCGGSWLREAAAQPPPCQKPCRMHQLLKEELCQSQLLLLKSRQLLKPKKGCLPKLALSTSLAYLAPRL
jgi:hypothetical protein